MTGLGALLRRFFGGSEEKEVEKETWIIFGLGNPGAKYAHTRHNAGFDVTDRLAAHYGAEIRRERCRGLTAEISEGGRRLVLCQPQTLMNLSGECVGPLMQWYKCPPEHILVICDDIDLPPGQLRIRGRGGPGTHNGLRSIAAHLPQGNYARLRVGTGAPPPERDLADWVLSVPAEPEAREALDRAADAARDWFVNGVDHAMSHYNGKGK